MIQQTEGQKMKIQHQDYGPWRTSFTSTLFEFRKHKMEMSVDYENGTSIAPVSGMFSQDDLSASIRQAACSSARVSLRQFFESSAWTDYDDMCCSGWCCGFQREAD
jgi:hypothetical protein